MPPRDRFNRRGSATEARDATSQKIDFLDENLRVTFSFTEKVGAHLPEVTPSDLRARREKYAILLGKVRPQEKNSVHVTIEAVMQVDPHDSRDAQGEALYTEHVEYVLPNLAAIQRSIEELRRAYPQYRNLEFIGDVHTHPVETHELDAHQRPWQPSDGDAMAVFEEYYTRGNLSSDRPFIFGVAAPHEGQTVYAFYRLIKRSNGEFEVQRISGK